MARSILYLVGMIILVSLVLFLPIDKLSIKPVAFWFAFLGLFILPAFFIKGSIKYSRKYIFQKEYPNRISLQDFVHKVDNFINTNGYQLINKSIDSNGCIYNIDIPASIWSWGNNLKIIVLNNKLTIFTVNTSFIQLIDYNVTNKKVANEIANFIEYSI